MAVREIAYDPWNATHIALRLQDEGAAMVEFRQGFRSMAAPTRELEKLIVSRQLAHGGNPVTRWKVLLNPAKNGSELCRWHFQPGGGPEFCAPAATTTCPAPEANQEPTVGSAPIASTP